MTALPGAHHQPVLVSHVRSLAVEVRRRRTPRTLEDDRHDRLRGQHDATNAANQPRENITSIYSGRVIKKITALPLPKLSITPQSHNGL